VTEPEDLVAISRIAAVVRKEELLERLLEIIQKHEYGINLEELVMMLNRLGYRKKVIQQLAYLGLIEQTNGSKPFCRITIKGSAVLDACKC
jgi:hypothetical protein